MTVSYIMPKTGGPGIVLCLSTDPKPAYPVGWVLLESNTGKSFCWQSSSWVETTPAGGPGGAAWGSITGTLSSQSDLQSALNAKAASGHNHDLAYAALGHNHDASYATLGHNHNADYAPLSHNHNSLYEPINAVSNHVAQGDPHTVYQLEAQKGQANGYASLDGSGLVPVAQLPPSGSDPYLAKLRLASDVTHNLAAFVDLTGMVFTYLANSFYIFDMYMMCTSAAATTGYRFGVNTSTAVTYVGLNFVHQLATTGTLSGGDSIADDAARGLSSGVPAVTVTNFAQGKGILVSGANGGTAQFRFGPEVAASATCKAGSIIKVMKVT